MTFVSAEHAEAFARTWDPKDLNGSWPYLCPDGHWHTKAIGSEEKAKRLETITKLDLRNRVDISQRTYHTRGYDTFAKIGNHRRQN